MRATPRESLYHVIQLPSACLSAINNIHVHTAVDMVGCWKLVKFWCLGYLLLQLVLKGEEEEMARSPPPPDTYRHPLGRRCCDPLWAHVAAILAPVSHRFSAINRFQLAALGEWFFNRPRDVVWMGRGGLEGRLEWAGIMEERGSSLLYPWTTRLPTYIYHCNHAFHQLRHHANQRSLPHLAFGRGPTVAPPLGPNMPAPTIANSSAKTGADDGKTCLVREHAWREDGRCVSHHFIWQMCAGHVTTTDRCLHGGGRGGDGNETNSELGHHGYREKSSIEGTAFDVVRMIDCHRVLWSNKRVTIGDGRNEL